MAALGLSKEIERTRRNENSNVADIDDAFSETASTAKTRPDVQPIVRYLNEQNRPLLSHSFSVSGRHMQAL